MTFEVIITELKKRKLIFIILPVLFFVFVFAVQYRLLQNFKSTSLFIVNETNINDFNNFNELRGDIAGSQAVNVNRIFLFAHSSQMMNYLIKKYRLYLYYQIDSTSQFAYVRLVNRLTHNIHLAKKDFNIMEVTVSDRDRVTASSLANDIVLTLNSINESYVKSQLKRKIVLYQALYQDMKNDMENERNKMSVILGNFQSIVSTLEKNKAEVEDLRHSLNDLSNSLKNKREEIVQVQKFNYILLQTLEKERLETITVINTALPDFSSNIPRITIISSVLTVLFFLSMILLLNVFLEYKSQIYFLFGKK